MEIRPTRLPGSDYKLRITQWDKEVLKDVYREDIYERRWVAQKPFDPLFQKLGRLAKGGSFSSIRAIRVDKGELQQLADSLTEYSNRTPAIIEEILYREEPSAERASALYYRDYLGGLAASLSLQIGVETGMGLGTVDVEKELEDMRKDFPEGSD